MAFDKLDWWIVLKASSWFQFLWNIEENEIKIYDDNSVSKNSKIGDIRRLEDMLGGTIFYPLT